ncbi:MULTISPECIES: helix-turn-helix domain-containing protein [Prauserella salsuginis group]|uniref:Transcriptional regulator GlxA family with amidase domain n=2 Tax=Prauserella salsuginis group TaxID=2893672 RepID=A0A839XJJ8_9PSEU|nr:MULTISPECIES: helix-turn-helix domain-containing protein [Prauserella salsuginis group]MBB3661724.1 transcriptional regulator GlxA family with amidase domain [Prauserella sediminis]MCR3719635.1 transcriptional regulator, AraC family with amidase-like domain [Prauserella flava]MCR3735351.1 transcriptional regulator, AraC family with amidase-like domain [Prauserella salsuginis]
MRTVALGITDNMSLFELSIPCAIFGSPRPEAAYSWYDLTVCSTPGARVGAWFRVDSPRGLTELAAANTVIVPACDDAVVTPPPELVHAVRTAHERGARVASICTGAFVLAAAGLLDGRRATTHWSYAEALAQQYPGIDVDADVLYVDDGDVLTSAGQAAGIDVCLHMVRTDYGAAAANSAARRLVVPPHRDGGQAQFVTTPLSSGNGHSLNGLLDWAIERVDQPLTVTDLAREAGLSPRQLSRQFLAVTGTSPLQWLLTQRIRRAQELLETVHDSVDDIAAQVGLGTAATLRRHFNRRVGTSPDAYRRTFQSGRGRPEARPAD